MNNEPVAWMLNGILHECDPSDWAKEQYPDQDVIPLYTHPVKEEHFEDEPQAEELHEIMQSNTHPVEEQDESFDRTASHMAGEYVSWTSCVACGQRVTGDSIHTCSPQLKQLTDEEIDDFTVRIYNCRTGAEAHEIVLSILRKAQDD